MSKFSRLVLFAVSLSALTVRGQAPRPMTLVDVMNVALVSDPQLSPDGSESIFVQAQANWKANRRISHRWKVNADGTGMVQMTSGAEGETTPRWSPDGKTVAFVA